MDNLAFSCVRGNYVGALHFLPNLLCTCNPNNLMRLEGEEVEKT